LFLLHLIGSLIVVLGDAQSLALSKESVMSKFKARKMNATPVEATPVVTPAPTPVAPVVASGRTVVDIAKELKITPQNARRIARKHAEALGHAGKGARWVLNADQEKALVDAITRELKRPAA
jgi:hypothetical protein